MKINLLLFLGLIVGATACELMPRNHIKDCRAQCKETEKPQACLDFCDCIHNRGEPIDTCLARYDQAPEGKTDK